MPAVPPSDVTPHDARAILGLPPTAGMAEIRRAFREAAKRAHPDRAGGDAARFRRVLEAYRVLQGPPLALPAPTVPTEGPLELTPAEAILGGEREVTLGDGRRVRLTLPAGLREGERLRAAETVFRIVHARQGDTFVRGDDLWMTAMVPPVLLAEGGRGSVETPAGPRTFWITRKAGERGLVRLDAEGLPARAGRPQGSLFLRLTADTAPVEDSPARQLLKRFAAAWAA